LLEGSPVLEYSVRVYSSKDELPVLELGWATDEDKADVLLACGPGLHPPLELHVAGGTIRGINHNHGSRVLGGNQRSDGEARLKCGFCRRDGTV
jgi:hypothetical protein